MLPSSDESPVVRRAARPWRRLTVASGALLALSAFLPAVRSCNSDIVPAKDYASVVSETVNQTSLAEAVSSLALWTPVLLLAYVAGLLLAMGAAARLAGRRRGDRWLSRGLVILLVATALDLLALFWFESAGPGSFPAWPDEWYLGLAFVVGPLATLIYLFVARRLPGRLLACAAFLACFWLVAWFSFWLPEALYGLAVSFIAAGLLLIASIGEARAIACQSWSRTIAQLFTGRLSVASLSRGRCRGCGYLLYGLSEMRCPECGRPFTRDETGLEPAQTPPPAGTQRPGCSDVALPSPPAQAPPAKDLQSLGPSTARPL